MDTKKRLGIIGGSVAFVALILVVTVVWASYTQALSINGSGTVDRGSWKIVFEDLQTATIGNDSATSGVRTAREIATPRIVGETTIETYSVSLTTPGDYISYQFKIHNAGTFNAQIDTIVIPTPICTKGANGTDADAINVCDYLSYTLSYVDAAPSGKPQAGASLSQYDTLDAGETRVVKLKLYYDKSIDSSKLPTDTVDISNLGITINYKQVA